MFDEVVDDTDGGISYTDYYDDWPDDLLLEELQLMKILNQKIISKECFCANVPQRYVS